MLNDQADRLEEILLRGDREAAAALAEHRAPEMLLVKNRVLHSLTDQYRAGKAPFCQLTAACQAAAAFYDAALPPVACCGAVCGNTSSTGRDFMMMLLRGWGMPALDLGTDVRPEAFLSAVREHGLRFVVCVAFSQADLEAVRELHRLALSQGIRDRFAMLVTGVNPDPAQGSIPADLQEHSAAAVAEWMVDKWMS